jgi:hypothetical protein
MQSSNRDMEYSAWVDWLTKHACAMYRMDPVEINFKFGNEGQSSGLQESSNKEKVVESKERGLRPLLRFLEDQFNKYLIWPVNESFEFAFVGLDAQTHDQVADLNQKRVKTILTVDELRAEEDLPPLPDGKGEIILDPTFLQWAQIKEGGDEGMPGEEDDYDDADEDQDEGPDEDEDMDQDGDGDEDQEDFDAMLKKYDKPPEGTGDEERKNQEENKPPVQKSMNSTVVIEFEV